MTIDGRDYPIGDAFTDASGIPQGSGERGKFGEQGYSTILAVGAQDYRLLWIDDGGQRKYSIVREDNVHFSGPDGFREQMKDLQVAEERTFDAVKIELGGLGALLVAELGICPATAGGGCAAAILTALGGVIGGFGLSMWRIFTDWQPAIDNVNAAFELLDLNSP